MLEILQNLFNYGLPGTVLAASLAWNLWMQRRLQKLEETFRASLDKEHDEYIATLKAHTAAIIEQHTQVHETVAQLGRFADMVQSTRSLPPRR